VVRKVGQEAAVVAAELLRYASRRSTAASALLGAALLALLPCAAIGAILPEDRADVMYHGYDGGGLEVDGPSVLVRKGFNDRVSVWGNYYVDMISSASIDVVATASPYTETRQEYSAGVDYLTGKTTMGLSYTYSDEDDYVGNTARFGISQDFFGDLTTLGISYARGWDDVMRNGDPEFKEHADRQDWRIDLSQVLTPSMVLSFGYEGITDEGFLHNPYRSARYLDPSSSKGFSYEAEVTPKTKTSSTWAIRTMYYLPYRAAARAEYRYYTDTWGVDGWNIQIGYAQPLANGLTLDLSYRYYTQTGADFYSDLFPRQNSQNFLSRDKELSTFSSNQVGIGLTYAFGANLMPPFFKRGEFSLFADYMDFAYDDFRNVLKGGTPGDEPLYSMDATILRAFISFWY
jgi:opacity protein-like surface antigen